MSKYNNDYSKHLEDKFSKYSEDRLFELYQKEPSLSAFSSKFQHWCDQIGLNKWIIKKKADTTEEERRIAVLRTIEAKQKLESFDDYLRTQKVSINGYNTWNKSAGPAKELTDSEKDIKALLQGICKKQSKKTKKQQVLEEEEEKKEDKEMSDYIDNVSEQEEIKTKEKPKKDKNKKESSKPKKE